jgi:hypothetical protein
MDETFSSDDPHNTQGGGDITSAIADASADSGAAAAAARAIATESPAQPES